MPEEGIIHRDGDVQELLDVLAKYVGLSVFFRLACYRHIPRQLHGSYVVYFHGPPGMGLLAHTRREYQESREADMEGI